MILQLNPNIPVAIVGNDLQIPEGRAFAIGWIDYSQEHNLIWIVFHEESGESWCVPNRLIRARGNASLERG